MKTTLIKIKNLYGIAETELDGSSVELTGANGTGKTSVLDAIRYALTNSSDRDIIIKGNAEAGEIIIETDTGLRIDRAKRKEKADYKSVKENGREVTAPESFLKSLFSPLQLDPVAFTQKTKAEQNRDILDLIEFDWDLNWIRDKFGEIPENVDYSQNILQVLNDIQAENGVYFQKRQDINREMRTKRNMTVEIAKTIPDCYDYIKWDTFPLSEKYTELAKIKEQNNVIERAKAFESAYKDKLRGIDAECEILRAEKCREIEKRKAELSETLARLKAEIDAAQKELGTLDSRLEEKLEAVSAYRETKISKLDGDILTARRFSGEEPMATEVLENEIHQAEAMRRHLNEFARVKQLQKESDELNAESIRLSEKIDIARTLPGIILENATLPVKGLTVENGIPLVNGLPVSNLSEGEKLSLCVDVAISNPSAIQLILLDGTEKLSDENRELLYKKCKDSGLQFIATRTTNENELKVVRV